MEDIVISEELRQKLDAKIGIPVVVVSGSLLPGEWLIDLCWYEGLFSPFVVPGLAVIVRQKRRSSEKPCGWPIRCDLSCGCPGRSAMPIWWRLLFRLQIAHRRQELLQSQPHNRGQAWGWLRLLDVGFYRRMDRLSDIEHNPDCLWLVFRLFGHFLPPCDQF
jgi:hypothetical protein